MSLAAQARQLLREDDPESNNLALEFYLKILEGKVPKLIRDEDGNPLKIGEEDYAPQPTLDQRMLAMARFTERAYGQPAQHMHIEAELRAEVTAIAGGVDTRYLQRLSPEALLAIKNAVKALPAAPPREAEDDWDSENEQEPVQDADYVEVK